MTEREAPLGPVVGRFDDWAETVLDRWRGRPGFELVFQTASQLGDWSLIWHLAGAVQAIGDDDPGRAAGLSVALGAESLLVNQGVKRLFGRVRPSEDGGPERAGRFRRPTTSSFPSGHASAAFCAAVLLSDRHRGQAPVWFALAAVVAVSRVFVRLHHASDVVAGALLGLLLGRAARSLLGRRAWD